MRVVWSVQNFNQNPSVLNEHCNAIASKNRLLARLRSVVIASTLLLFSTLVSAEQQSVEGDRQVLKLEVIDPYIEIRTGPGRGYPVFYVIEQGEYIEVLTRRPGWYEVRARSGSVGWTSASQVSRTLQPSGEPVDLPSVSYGDYLKNSWRVGFMAGSFVSGELKGMDDFSFNFGYRPLSWLAFDIEAGNLYGLDIKGNYSNANVLIEPFSRWRFSPVLLWGAGSMKISSQPKSTQFDIDRSNFQIYGVGIHSYLGRNFVVRTEYRAYSIATDNNNERLETWRIGFNTFF